MTDIDAQDDPSESGNRGIFDGFAGYMTHTEEEWKNVFSNGMVVVDTNVLLNLYRYNQVARTSLLNTLREFDTRLWVPNQVMLEFWRNRESALEDPRKQLEQSASDLRLDLKRATSNLNAWVNRVSLDQQNATKLRNALSQAFEEVISTMEDVVGSSGVETGRYNSKDEVLISLASLLQGKVGGPLGKVDLENAIAEGKRRLESQIPPGYMDKKKEARADNSEIGDYLVWLQVMHEAKKRAKDVLLVTGDTKEDWWRTRNRMTLGPRNELAEELLREANVHLYMLNPERLLVYAGDFLAVTIVEGSVQNVKLVDEIPVEEVYFAAYRQYVREHGEFPNARQFARFLPTFYGGTAPEERELVTIIRDMRYRFTSKASTETIP